MIGINVNSSKLSYDNLTLKLTLRFIIELNLESGGNYGILKKSIW